MRLILVRHGETTSNVTHALDTGDPGADLTEKGRGQAEALVQRLSSHDVGLLMTSNLVRTHQTAQPLASARGMTPLRDKRIREILAGELEMRHDRAAVTAYLTTVSRWLEGDYDARMPGAEHAHEVLDRFDAAVEVARAEVGDGLAVLVSHGAIIRTWSALRGTNVPSGWAVNNVIGNTGWVELSDATGQWQVESWEGMKPLSERIPTDANSHAARVSVSDGDLGGRL